MAEKGFFKEVYDIVETIPPGRVATYGQIAMLLGRPNGAKFVGYAMRSAPIERDLPCHRVVNKTGSLAPGHVFNGEENQREILEREGITFLPNGRIDMKKHAL